MNLLDFKFHKNYTINQEFYFFKGERAQEGKEGTYS